MNFGIVYGQQAYGLSQTLDIPMAEAREMIDAYFRAYPGVRTYLDETVTFAKQTGYAETMYGRRRPIPELRIPAQRMFGERTAMNHPMQGSVADIIKIAMVRVAERLRAEGFTAKMVLQVHDELDFECPVGEVDRLIAMVREEMEGVAELRCPSSPTRASARRGQRLSNSSQNRPYMRKPPSTRTSGASIRSGRVVISQLRRCGR